MLPTLTDGLIMTTHHRLIAATGVLLFVSMLSGLACAAVQNDAPTIAAPPVESMPDGRVFCNGVRRQDEILVVNTRMIGCNCDPDALRTGLLFEDYAVIDEAGYRRWQPTDLEGFLSRSPSTPTIIFIHGNQITSSDAKNEGLAVYRRLMRYGADGPPIRFVIFSWPSARVGGLLRDVRVKATRTDPTGCQLAWLLDQMPAETPISLVGFSYGARIITAGLHIYAGGHLGSLALAERAHPHRAPMNVVLMSAALHAHWLGEGQYHGLAMTQVNQMLLLNNCSDIAMRFYHLAFKGRRGRPQGLGLRGPTQISYAEREKIQMRDLSRYGSQHDLFLYICAPGVAGQIWDLGAGAPAPTLQAAR
jgi:hypothetical protein